MIKGIQVQNFRGIKKCIIKNLDQVNILVGKNSAGKSTILEAVYLASAWAQPLDKLRLESKLDYVISRRMNRGSWKNTRRILWHNMNTSQNIEISLAIGKEQLKFLLTDSSEKAVHLVSSTTLRPARLETPLEEPEEKTTLQQYKIFLENVALLDSNLPHYMEKLEKQIWPLLLAERLDKILVSMIKEAYEPQAEGLTYMPLGDEYSLALQLADTTVRVDDLGGGAKNAVIYTAVLLTLKNTAVLMEEPEIHQHPAGLATLLNFVLKIAKQNNLQLIITTHSIELIKILQRLVKEHELPIRIFHLERTPKGIIEVRELEEIDIQVMENLR